MHALRIFIPGQYEDAFVYMDHLLAVGTDRALLRMNLAVLLDDVIPPRLRRIAYLWVERNDLLAGSGVQALMGDGAVRTALENSFANQSDGFLAEPKWTTSEDYERLLGDATVLDLQIYAQRLFAATTNGVLHADLIDDGVDFYFARPAKRTDARCVSVTVRFGALAASCEDDGLLISFDEFGELGPHHVNGLGRVAAVSQRSAWLGYNLVNYRDSAHGEGLRSRYKTIRETRRRDVVLTELSPDTALLGATLEEWETADFIFNDHARFFVHHNDGHFEVHQRAWSRGRLGRTLSTWSGEMDRPLSAVPAAGTLAIETYDAVWLLSNDTPEILYEGEAIVVRSFPSSVRYRNLVAIIDDEGLHLISPFLPGAEEKPF